ncbi:MAG: type I-E CRISPR-associated protein Cas7/Cse4/CasC [Firmicutes bacterium]|jgi:CRISPR system Cascade subunit CasC|nr:type I-E CRISPR-associated protein Cas7/Cse4/CasC [Bacillota bacterium]
MLLEFHLLQNHAPSNLNRDDSGSPKDCIFGGVRRARISSQCLKRSIRTSPLFTEEIGGIDLGLRTRKLPHKVKEILLARGIDEALAEVAAAKATGFGNKDGKEQKDGKTAQVMFLSPQDIEAVAEVLFTKASTAGSAEDMAKLSAKDLQAEAALKGWRPITPDIGLFGRMITSEAFRDVQAAVQVAHAISTHRMDHEFDYFTAVDDLLGLGEEEDDAGAGMIGDIEFNSACYYKYFSIDYDAFVQNLAGPEPETRASEREKAAHREAVADARTIAAKVIPAFLRAAVFTTPSGKQNTFAAHQLPDAVLVEVRPHQTPVSYANAFVSPARAKNDVDLVGDSLRKFVEHCELLTRKFSLEADPRLWFCTRDIQVTGTTGCDTMDDLLAALGQVLAR